MSIESVAAVGAVTSTTLSGTVPLSRPAPAAPAVSFSQLFSDGIGAVSQKADQADAMVKSFILDDSIPPHRVIYALEQSSLSLQMMLQIRNRLVEGYQDIMRMQL